LIELLHPFIAQSWCRPSSDIGSVLGVSCRPYRWLQ
jgi:hypothetical protein